MNRIEMQMSQGGFLGCVHLADTSTHVGPYSKIRATEASVTNTITIGGAAITTNIVLAINEELLGHITEITLTSGAVLAYTESA